MTNENPFFQDFLGSAYEHTEGPFALQNGDGTVHARLDTYPEIRQFLIENGPNAFVSLIVGGIRVGFALCFPLTAPADNPTPSFSIARAGRRWDVYMVTGSPGKIATLMADLQPVGDDTHTVETVIPVPTGGTFVSDEDADNAVTGYLFRTIEQLEDAFFERSS